MVITGTQMIGIVRGNKLWCCFGGPVKLHESTTRGVGNRPRTGCGREIVQEGSTGERRGRRTCCAVGSTTR